MLGAAAPSDHRRLLLVTDTDAHPLQHVYVDSEAVPLLVGVQSAGPDRTDDEVLLRLLDRVAVELPRWRHGRLRELVGATHGDRDEARLLAKALDWTADPAAFWARVESNLSRDRVRIVLVTDRVSDELTRVVEFLDGQLRDVELGAVEVSLYGSGQVSVLVPRGTRRGPTVLEARHDDPQPGPPPVAARAAPNTDRPGRHRLT